MLNNWSTRDSAIDLGVAVVAGRQLEACKQRSATLPYPDYLERQRWNSGFATSTTGPLLQSWYGRTGSELLTGYMVSLTPARCLLYWLTP